MKATHAVLLAAILCSSYARLSAQVVSPVSGPVDPSLALKNQLRKLVVAQENYFADHGTYTTDVLALGMYRGRAGARTDSIFVNVVQAGGRSWWGRAVHRTQTDKNCIIYVGTTADFTSPPTTDGGQVRAQEEGEPVCDPS